MTTYIYSDIYHGFRELNFCVKLIFSVTSTELILAGLSVAHYPKCKIFC